MNVTWILEPAIFTPYLDALTAEIKSQGDTVRTLPKFYTSLDWGDTSRYYVDLAPQDSCVVCHASTQFCSLVAEDDIWVPGTYGVGDALDCSNYFSHFDGYLFNGDHELLTVEDLVNNANTLFRSFGVDGLIFIRPDSGGKAFTGRLFTKEELTAPSLRAAGAPPKSLLVVSRPKPIEREWRFIVVDRKVIAASRYKEAGKVCLSKDVPDAAMDFAVLIAAREFQPDRVWVLDVCETPTGEMRVVEINGFSSADWYCCNLRDIVSTVSGVAVDDWRKRTGRLTK